MLRVAPTLQWALGGRGRFARTVVRSAILLTELLGSPAFRDRLAAQRADFDSDSGGGLGDSDRDGIEPAVLDPAVQRVGKWAQRGLWKCRLDGLQNPVCHAAIGLTIACFVAELWEDFGS